MKRVAILCLLVALMGCSEPRTWQSEIDTCVQTTAQPELCWTTAGFAIHIGCHLEGYQSLVATLMLGAPVLVAWQAVHADGHCPPPPPPSGGAPGGVIQGN